MFGGGVGFVLWFCWISIKRRCKQKMWMDQTFNKVEKLCTWNLIVVWDFFIFVVLCIRVLGCCF